MQEIKTVIDDTGAIFLPEEYRKFFDLKPGDGIVIKLDREEIRIVPLRKNIRRAQGLVRKYIPAGRKLVDELITERRRESKNE